LLREVASLERSDVDALPASDVLIVLASVVRAVASAVSAYARAVSSAEIRAS
jgi:hypothetical protein